MLKDFFGRIETKRLLGLIGYILIACFIVLIVKPPYLVSIFIVLVPPAITNFLWLKKSRSKVLIFSLLSAVAFAPSVELMARLANAWDVQSVLPRIFGLMPLENMFFAFLNFFWVLSFYEYFVDRDRQAGMSVRFKYLVGLYCLFTVVVFGLYFYDQGLVTHSYYVLSVPILIVPAAIIFSIHPRLLKKVVLPTAFFALTFFVYETISLIIGSWWWPGEYLVGLNLFGNRFPLDDVIIWYFLSTPALIGGYEFFADDRK